MPILRRSARLAGMAIVWLLTLLSLSSFVAYTTAGFDFEVPTAQGVEVRYDRLRWDDGSTWVGFAVQPCPRPDRALNWFDPGGTLFAAPTRPERRSRWNTLGFWHVEGPSDDPYLPVRYPGATSDRWWACPSWVVLIVLWSRTIWRFAVRVARFGRPSDMGPMTPE